MTRVAERFLLEASLDIVSLNTSSYEISSNNYVGGRSKYFFAADLQQ